MPGNITKIGTVWSDLDPNYKTDGQGNIKINKNVEAVMGAIDNILRTSPGERVLLSDFGCRIDSMLFDNMNSALMNWLSREIRSAIERWDNRVIVTQVDFLENPDMHTVSISIKFAIRGYNNIFEYKSSFKGG